MLALCVAAAAIGCGGGGGGGGRAAETITCTPGATVTVGCGAESLGTCTGDPILTVCETTTPIAMCGESGVANIDRNDDNMGLCPGLDFTCPASGMVHVRPTAFGTREFSCDWAVSEAPGDADAGM